MPAVVLPARGLRRAGTLSRSKRYVLVGAVGFLVDLCACKAMMGAGLPPLVARLPSMLLGLTATFLLHRATAIPSARSLRDEVLRYGQANAVVAAVNYTVFAVALLGTHGLLPLAALTVGSGAAFAVGVLDLRERTGGSAANDDSRRQLVRHEAGIRRTGPSIALS